MKRKRQYQSPLKPEEVKALGGNYLREKQGSLLRMETSGFDPEKHYGKMRGKLLDDGFLFKIAPPSSSGMYIDAKVTAKSYEEGSLITLDVAVDWLWKLACGIGAVMMVALVIVAIVTDDFQWMRTGGQMVGESDIVLMVSPLYIGIFAIVTAIALPHYKKKMHAFVESKLLGREVSIQQNEPWKV